MAAWFSANMANIIIIVLLVLVIGSAVRRMIRNKKAGRTSCGCGCASCNGGCAGGCAGGGKAERLENTEKIG